MSEAFPAFGMPGGWEWILIVIVALLIFGRRLPDVARSVGKSIVEFKKGIKDIETDIDEQSKIDRSKPARLDSKPDGNQERTVAGTEKGKDAEPAAESSRRTG